MPILYNSIRLYCTTVYAYTVQQYTPILYNSIRLHCTTVYAYPVQQYTPILYNSIRLSCTTVYAYTVQQYTPILYNSICLYCTTVHAYTVQQYTPILYNSIRLKCTSPTSWHVTRAQGAGRVQPPSGHAGHVPATAVWPRGSRTCSFVRIYTCGAYVHVRRVRTRAGSWSRTCSWAFRSSSCPPTLPSTAHSHH
jgi:hypothetical protein